MDSDQEKKIDNMQMSDNTRPLTYTVAYCSFA